MMYELGLRFIMHGHRVTVATSWRSDRSQDSIDGIKIIGFKVTGNAISGMHGEIESYQQYLISAQFDFLLVMAAQQWTFDAMLAVLDRIECRKLHIPCGYSSFYIGGYQTYYRNMVDHLSKFDTLIYNASDYRDINYARSHGLTNINVIPAGASELEFIKSGEDSQQVRAALGIATDAFLYLSVGAPAYNKGHKEILQAYLSLDLPFDSALVLNGNYDSIPQLTLANGLVSPKEVLKELTKRTLGRSSANIVHLAQRNRDRRKKIVFANLQRKELINLYFAADLFLFASHVEYSPLVIFECLAAGLPFLSIPVGNVTEIAEWSGGGEICSGQIDAKGYSSAIPAVLAAHIHTLSLDAEKRKKLAIRGRLAWQERFTWDVISRQIESLVMPSRE